MITGTLKSKIDQIWTEFWAGGITNPLTVIEQISYLMFARMLDINEMKNEKRATRLKKELGDDRIFKKNQQHLRWHNFKELPANEMFDVVKDEVFPFFQKENREAVSCRQLLEKCSIYDPKTKLAYNCNCKNR
jgi:type I restriction enzyme M protein